MQIDIWETVIWIFRLWGGLGVFTFIFCFLGRLFGFYHPAFYQFFLLVPWRPFWRIYIALSEWKERVFSMGRKATAGWPHILSVLCIIYRPNHLLLGRAMWMGLPLPQSVGVPVERHVVMIAGTGAGKTVLLQTLLGLHRGSALVIDPKLQADDTMQAARKQLGPVYTLAPFSPERSHSWNPLDEIEAAIKRFGIDTAPRFLLKIAASTILRENNENPFFPDSARDIWAAIVAFVYVRETGDKRNLITARRYLMEGLCPQDFDNPTDAFLFLLSEMQRCTEFEGFIAKRAIALQNTGAEALGNVLATARTQTQWLDLPEVRGVMTRSDFLLADLKRDENPMTLFLGAPVTAIRGELSRWFRLIVEMSLYLFEIIPGNLKQPCLYALDEMPSLGHIEAIETAAPLLRSFGVRLLAIAQDTERLAQVYPKSWQGFLGNADVVYWMGTNHDGTVGYLERSLGQTTHKEKISGGWFSSEPKRYNKTERPLMYAEQIKRFLDPDSGNMIITRFGKRPLRVKQTPFYTELPVWLYDPDPNFSEAPARAWLRQKITQFSLKYKQDQDHESK